MPPELVRQRAYDPFKADIWSAAITFFFIAVGRIPWKMGTTQKLIEDIESGVIEYPEDMDEEFVDAIGKMTLLDWKARPTAAECLQFPIFADAQAKDGYIPVDKGGKAVCVAGTILRTVGKRLVRPFSRTPPPGQISPHVT
jgi:serine/threonine protein kinase